MFDMTTEAGQDRWEGGQGRAGKDRREGGGAGKDRWEGASGGRAADAPGMASDMPGADCSQDAAKPAEKGKKSPRR